MATDVRARLSAKLAEITPGDIDAFFFTNGGAEANENAIRIARLVHRTSQDRRALSLVSRRHRRRVDVHRRSTPLGRRARHPRVFRIPDFYHGIQKGNGTRQKKCSHALKRCWSLKDQRRSRH